MPARSRAVHEATRRRSGRVGELAPQPFTEAVDRQAVPLQAGSPCASAPILWIEPIAGPSERVPSARTSALRAPRPSVTETPGVTKPRSIMLRNGMRGSARLLGKGEIASGGKGVTAAIRRRASAA